VVVFRGSDAGGFLSSHSKVASARPWRAALLAAAISLVITALVAWLTHTRHEQEVAEDLVEQGQALATAVGDALDEVIERLVSVGSFYQASAYVTRAEFRRFIANFTHIPGMGGIGYMPIVSTEDLAGFEAEVRQTIPEYFVFEFDEEGNRVPVAERPFHVPVLWFEPEQAFGRPHGFDSASEAARASTLLRARTQKAAAVTTFLQLLSEGEDDGFLIYWPVTDPDSNEVIGYTVAPMDLGELLDDHLSPSISEELTWDIEVMTRGRAAQPVVDKTWFTAIDVGSNWWGLTVTTNERRGLPLDRAEQSLLTIIGFGVATSVLGATVVYQLRRRRETQDELAQLLALTRAKDQFLASVSHELRTPLTGVLGFAELLREDQDDMSDEDRRSMIASVAAEATDLSSIIDDLLVAARSELDLLAITRVQVSLRAQVSQVLESIDATTRDRVEMAGDAPRAAIGDPGRVRQIVRNLITNAGRYGGNRIQIRLGASAEGVVLDVADNGPGVPSSEEEKIFEPYYRAHQSAGTQPAALGIGLSVARHLARLMEGDLSYRREAGWSVFSLVLPAAGSVEEVRRDTALERVST
jgi:signal transduction histidine kinase